MAANDLMPTAMEWMFLVAALIVTVPILLALRYLLRELKKEPTAAPVKPVDPNAAVVD